MSEQKRKRRSNLMHIHYCTSPNFLSQLPSGYSSLWPIFCMIQPIEIAYKSVISLHSPNLAFT